MSLVPVVEQVVNEKVQAGEMFTAHDVTLEVRGRGHRAGHTEVRSAVHDYYNRGGMGVAYTRSTITVPGGTPFLYHRLVDDPATFANVRGLNMNVPTSATITVPPPSAVVDDDEDEDEDEDEDDVDDGNSFLPSNLLGNLSVAGVAVQPAPTVKKGATNKPGQVNSRQVDDRGTLSIPTNLIRGAGLRTHQKVYAFSDGSGAVVIDSSKPAVVAQGGVHEYTVDSHDQVRITQTCLRDAGIPGKTYNLELTANSQILVKAA